MPTTILKYSEISDASKIQQIIKNRCSNANALIIAPDSAGEKFIKVIESYLCRLLEDNDVAAFDAGRLFDGKKWKLPSLTKQHLPVILGVRSDNINQEILDRIICMVSGGDVPSDVETVRMSYCDACNLAYAESDHICQSGILYTDNCNLKCDMCMFHSSSDAHYGFKKERRHDRNKMTLPDETVKKYIDDLPNGSMLLFSASGEFLTSRAGISMLEYSAKKGIRPALITNGLLLDSYTAERLLQSGVTQIIVSVDGHNKRIYDKYRKGGSFDQVVKNIENVKALRDKINSKTRISVNCIMFEDIKSAKTDVIEFWSNRVDQLTFLAEREDYYGKARELFVSVDEDFVCTAPLEGVILLSNGLIAPCCSIAIAEWFEKFTWLRSINEAGVKESTRYYRDMMLDSDSPLREFCRRCQYWRHSYVKLGISPYSEIYHYDSCDIKKKQGITNAVKRFFGI